MSARVDLLHRDDGGVYTAEGNVAGARAGRLTKEREASKAAFQAQKRKMREAESKERVSTIDSKFNSYKNHREAEFKAKSYGLHTAAEFKALQVDIVSSSSLCVCLCVSLCVSVSCRVLCVFSLLESNICFDFSTATARFHTHFLFICICGHAM